MSELHTRLVEAAAKASADRWGHRNDPPGYIAVEDARVMVYAILRSLANSAYEVNEDHSLVILARELDDAADALDKERFQARGVPYRLPWEELQIWAESSRQIREAEQDRDFERRYGRQG